MTHLRQVFHIESKTELSTQLAYAWRQGDKAVFVHHHPIDSSCNEKCGPVLKDKGKS